MQYLLKKKLCVSYIDGILDGANFVKFFAKNTLKFVYFVI